jgi:3-deoxy-D-manno-octulosonate 8-phosphate phosphatase (KDO 8-P phosphatase)
MNNIKYIVIDVDGTLTDGSILISSNGEEILAFSIYDGFSIVK